MGNLLFIKINNVSRPYVLLLIMFKIRNFWTNPFSKSVVTVKIVCIVNTSPKLPHIKGINGNSINLPVNILYPSRWYHVQNLIHDEVY